MRKLLLGAAASSAVATILTMPLPSAAAGAAPPMVAAADSDAAVIAYWTPERMQSAKRLDMVVAGPVRRGHAPHVVPGARQAFAGAAPTEAYDFSLAAMLWETPGQQGSNQAKLPPPLLGSGNIPFTTNRLYPQNDRQLNRIYPYATVGQLYFTEPSGNYVCSASVIRASTIATAGHCVADGNGTYYSNWLFVPGENGSVAPFGKWTWATAWTSSAWWSGGGAVPNEQDDALIILAQQNYHKVLHRVGDLTGYLGYEYNAALPTAITQLGYPCNLDSCVDPVAAYSQDTAGPTNNFQWGTASAGGSSGGPEIQDFGQAPSGVPSEILGGNILVSSTSYVYTTPGVYVEGGSILYAPGQNGERTFGDLINWACGNNGC